MGLKSRLGMAGGKTEQNDSDSQETEDENPGLVVASPNVTITGAIHASGEAYLTVETLHTPDPEEDEENTKIGVRPSCHESGVSEVTVEETVQLELDELPEPAESGKGFTRVIEDEFSRRGSVHSAGTLNITIDKLVIIPTTGEGHGRRGGEPVVFKALAEAGYDCYDEIRLNGSIHSVGTANVTVKDLYIYPSQ